MNKRIIRIAQIAAAGIFLLLGTVMLVGRETGNQQNGNQNGNGNMNGNANGNMNGNMNHNANGNMNGNRNANMNGNRNGNMNGNMNSGGSAGGGMTLSSDDRKFMMTAAMGGMAEVEMARLALQRASSDTVKQYAQHMLDDHTRANDELMQIATSKGVTLPTTLDAKHAALMQRLQGLSGAEFDQTYMREAGIKSHSEMEKLFQKEATKGRDAETKAFASKTLPTVREHLNMARTHSGGSMNSNMNRSNR
jgi:putative membrane protein